MRYIRVHNQKTLYRPIVLPLKKVLIASKVTFGLQAMQESSACMTQLQQEPPPINNVRTLNSGSLSVEILSNEHYKVVTFVLNIYKQ